MPIKIRKATDSDLPAIVKLMAVLEYDGAPPVSLAKAKKIFATMKRYPDYRFYVATLDKKIVGTYALLILDTLADQGSPEAIVEDVAVDPAYQGKQIGTKMMHHAMKLAKKRKCFKLVLSSSVRRKRAHEFYRKLGFTQHGVSFGVE